MSRKVITLPNRDEMIERLVKVNDDSRLQERFYPILLKQAGQKYAAQDIVFMLVRAIYNYVAGMPGIVAELMYMSVPDFIDALIIDPQTANEAKAFIEKAYATK